MGEAGFVQYVSHDTDQAGTAAFVAGLSDQNTAVFRVIRSGPQSGQDLSGHQMGGVTEVAVDIAQAQIRKSTILGQKNGGPAFGGKCRLQKGEPVIQQRGDQKGMGSHGIHLISYLSDYRKNGRKTRTDRLQIFKLFRKDRLCFVLMRGTIKLKESGLQP